MEPFSFPPLNLDWVYQRVPEGLKREGSVTMAATLRMTRTTPATPLMEIHRCAFDVLVDGERIGSVDDQGIFEAPIDAGGHTLEVHAGRYSSRAVSFRVSDGEEIRYRCHGRRIWPILLASLVVPRLALKLRMD